MAGNCRVVTEVLSQFGGESDGTGATKSGGQCFDDNTGGQIEKNR